MALELRSQLCTFENSTKCYEISFDLHSFSGKLIGLFIFHLNDPADVAVLGWSNFCTYCC